MVVTCDSIASRRDTRDRPSLDHPNLLSPLSRPSLSIYDATIASARADEYHEGIQEDSGAIVSSNC